MDYLWHSVLNHDRKNCSMCKPHGQDTSSTDVISEEKSPRHWLWKTMLNHNLSSCSLCKTEDPELCESAHRAHRKAMARQNIRKRDPTKQKIAAEKLAKVLKKKLEKMTGRKVVIPSRAQRARASYLLENTNNSQTDNLMTTPVKLQSGVKSEVPLACLSFTDDLSEQPNRDQQAYDDSSSDTIEEDYRTSTHPTPVISQIEEIEQFQQPSTSRVVAPDVTESAPMAVLRCHLCETCNEPFDDWSEYNLHKQLCGLIFPCPCPTCGNMVPNQSGYLYHLDFHKKLTYNFKCESCEVSFATNGTLRNHIRLKRPCNTVTTLCKFCGKLYPTEADLAAHVETCDKRRQKYMCDICSDQLGTRASLARHIQLVHERDQRKNDYICHHCGKTFSYKSGLNKHMMKHADRKYKCFECGRKFIYFSNLKYHMRIHLREMKNKME